MSRSSLCAGVCFAASPAPCTLYLEIAQAGMCAGTFPVSDPSSLSLASLKPRQVSGEGWFAEPWSVWVTLHLWSVKFHLLIKTVQKIKSQSPKTAGGVNWCCCGACSSLGPGTPWFLVLELSQKEQGKLQGRRGLRAGPLPSSGPCLPGPVELGSAQWGHSPSLCLALLLAVVFPQDLLEKGLDADNFAMLGLGDIVIPGEDRREDGTGVSFEGLRGAERVPGSALGRAQPCAGLESPQSACCPGATRGRSHPGHGTAAPPGLPPPALPSPPAPRCPFPAPLAPRYSSSATSSPSLFPSPCRDLHCLAAAV